MDKDRKILMNVTILDNERRSPSDSLKSSSATTEMDSAATAPLGCDTDSLVGYRSHRLKAFEKLKEEYDDEVASMRRRTIGVSLPDYGRSIAETSWETTPVDIARYLGANALVQKIVVARVDGELWDLDRPLERSCSLVFLKFDTFEGKRTFWRSSAHVLGQVIEPKFGCGLYFGSVNDHGFSYELDLAGRTDIIKPCDHEFFEDAARQIIGANLKFERLSVRKEDLLEMFKHNKHKVRIIMSEIPDKGRATVYRCGSFVDLCTGPHMRDTGKIGVFEIEDCEEQYPQRLPASAGGWKSPAGFLQKTEVDSVYHIYGISIPKKELLEDRNKIQLNDADDAGVHGEFTAEDISNLQLLANAF